MISEDQADRLQRVHSDDRRAIVFTHTHEHRFGVLRPPIGDDSNDLPFVFGHNEHDRYR